MLQEMNIEDVDKTMDEISEAQDQMQQMNDVLAQPIGGTADLDDDELAAELAVSLACNAVAYSCKGAIIITISRKSQGRSMASLTVQLSWQYLQQALCLMQLQCQLLWVCVIMAWHTMPCKLTSCSSSQQELEAEDLDNQLLEPAPVPITKVPARAQPAAAATERMPAVPAGRPAPRPKQKTAEELELEALEAEMAA